MPFLRSLLIVLALSSPALAADGPQIAAGAKDAAQALRLHLAAVAKSGERPDYAKPPASELFRRIFNADELAALPPPRPDDMPWVLDWLNAANQTEKLIMFFGTEPGANLDQAAAFRNVAEYEDQHAAATNFLIRIGAREATTALQFLDQLAPEQRTPTRAAGQQRARHGGAELIESVIGSVALGMRPANARLMTAAMRDTSDVWATFIAPEDRRHLADVLATAETMVTDDEANEDLAAFAATLAAAK
jgi:hypothetical protein